MDRKDIEQYSVDVEQCSLYPLVLGIDKNSKDFKLASNSKFKGEGEGVLSSDTSQEINDFKLKPKFEEQDQTHKSN